MESFRGILYCEAYMDDEFSIADLDSMLEEIRKNYGGYSDVILKKTGAYSVAVDAQLKLARRVKEFRHFVYVVDNAVKRASAQFAATSYMKHYATQVASSREEACELLAKLS